ncbi:MAG TPA: hypothetical protein PK529_13750 [Verrucomicrobiales bacterium]|nr:hypothetical protein [Verrucomicrobiales bacterium]
MRSLDFSSGGSFLSTLLAITLVTVMGVGIRLLIMATVQQRRERANRQINERLRLLMAAYKTLGGSFTGDLSVDPAHLRELRQLPGAPGVEFVSGSDRSRRMRDAVESALSDIILLGTEEQVRLAGFAAQELVEGRHVPTHDLVVSLRHFIREALDLEPIPTDLRIPRQGPTRPQSSGGKSKASGSEDSSGRGGSGGQRGGGSGGGGAGGGAGMAGLDDENESANDR